MDDCEHTAQSKHLHLLQRKSAPELRLHWIRNGKGNAGNRTLSLLPELPGRVGPTRHPASLFSNREAPGHRSI